MKRARIELRGTTAQDAEFAFETKKQALGPHVISKWGWDEQLQKSLHQQRWLNKTWFVLQFAGQDIGTVAIDEADDQIRLGEFYLLDGFRNQGFGSMILQYVLETADQRKQTVVLEVLKWNPVFALYQRNGFEVTAETDIHYHMLRQPQPL